MSDDGSCRGLGCWYIALSFTVKKTKNKIRSLKKKSILKHATVLFQIYKNKERVLSVFEG